MRWIIAIVTAAWIIGIGPAFWLLTEKDDAPPLALWKAAVCAAIWPPLFYFVMFFTVFADVRARFRR